MYLQELLPAVLYFISDEMLNFNPLKMQPFPAYLCQKG